MDGADRNQIVSEGREKLLEMAVRPLADDAEMRLAAIGLLAASAQVQPEAAERAVQRWDAHDGKRKFPWLKLLFVAILTGLSAWTWTVATKEVLVYRQLRQLPWLFSLYNHYSESAEPFNRILPARLSLRERWLLLGDFTRNTRGDAMKALWEQEPDDPALFMEYVIYEGFSRRKGTELEFLETARRLDPDNAWPTYVAGAMKMRNSIKLIQSTSTGATTPKVREWNILDAAKLDEGIHLFHEACLQPGLDTYQPRLIELRGKLLPVEDHLGYLTAVRMGWPGEWTGPSPRGELAAFLPAMAAKSQLQVAAGDRAGFVSMMADFEILNRRWVDGELDGYFTESAYGSGLWNAVPRLHESAVALGAERESALLAGILRAWEIRGQRRNDFNEWIDDHGSLLLIDFRPMFSEVWHPTWTEKDLEAGRLADHELLSRGCCLVAWLILGSSLGMVAVFRFRAPPMIRRLSTRIVTLLGAADHGWIIGIGVVVPYAYMMMVNRLTPLGGRGLGIEGTHFLLPMMQFFGLVLLMLLAPLWIARWRLEKQAGVLGFQRGKPGRGVVPVAAAAALVPVSGWLATRELRLEWAYPLAFFTVGLPVLALLWSGLRALFSPPGLKLLDAAVISRALIPAYATALLLLAGAAVLHKAGERYWFRHDMTMQAARGFPGLSPFSYWVGKEVRGEIREILGMKE